MSEQSPEAVVAGQAAAAAVDEVKERQELADETTSAVIAAEVAEERSTEAANLAAAAAGAVGEVSQEAGQATSMAGAAAETAEEAREIATGSVDYAQQAFSESQATRADLEEFKKELRALLIPASETETNVEEVPVNDNVGTETPSAEAHSEEASEPQSRQYGRRVRRGRGN